MKVFSKHGNPLTPVPDCDSKEEDLPDKKDNSDTKTPGKEDVYNSK